ncbi:hypothetical protein HB4184_07845 [Pseudomonas putida]|nr:hypothetical protein HB4184_07845 [Pseudomonas putida]
MKSGFVIMKHLKPRNTDNGFKNTVKHKPEQMLCQNLFTSPARNTGRVCKTFMSKPLAFWVMTQILKFQSVKTLVKNVVSSSLDLMIKVMLAKIFQHCQEWRE